MHRSLKFVLNIFFVNLIFLGIIHAQDSQNPDIKQITKFQTVKEMPDIEIGSPKAKLKLIVYSALNCSHCASFHNKVFPQLKAKYISTGQMQFIFRYFPIDLTSVHSMAVIAALPQEKWFDAITKAYARQKEWMGKEYTNLARICGLSDDKYKKTIQDSKVLDSIMAKRFNAEQRITINATPTFQLISSKGEIVIDKPISDKELDKKIASLL